MLDLLTIGELASRTGVATSALRYDEELGLMPAARRVFGRRRYDALAVGFVGMILLLRDVGFSLAETKARTSPRPWPRAGPAGRSTKLIPSDHRRQ